MLGRFQWWRNMRGGKWSRVTGLLWGRKWVHVPYSCQEKVEENWGRPGWKRPFDWWNEQVWVPFYCRFAWFHLMRANSDGHFIIVWQRKGEPSVEGYHIESSSWTPCGCHRAARGTIFFGALMDAVGPEGRRYIATTQFKRGPQP